MSRIILHTELNAEDNAMLQALYSRSVASVTDHLEKLKQTGSSSFMSRYYLGYGHASIGDCGSETMYFEGISMLAAKALEDNPLFVGQECSSRYIDFSNQPFYNPGVGTESGIMVMLNKAYRDFYTSSLEPLKTHIKSIHPKEENVADSVYDKTVAARAFDILRGFLPASATTNVAWTARLSNAGEHLTWMMHHPLYEVRRLGAQAYKQLQAKYPNSFNLGYAALIDCESELKFAKSLEELEGKDVYDFMSDIDNFYCTPLESASESNKICDSKDIFTEIIIEEDAEFMKQHLLGYKNRQKFKKLHKHSLLSRMSMYVSTNTDFGSFRDIQRHRNGYCSMPLLTDEYGLHPWYYENLPEEIRRDAYVLLNTIEEAYNTLMGEDRGNKQREAELQYLLPMGTVVSFAMKYDLQQAVYVAELRSGKTVHATARPVAQTIGAELEKFGIPIWYNKEEDNWTVKRGTQDIVAKPEA